MISYNLHLLCPPISLAIPPALVVSCRWGPLERATEIAVTEIEIGGVILVYREIVAGTVLSSKIATLCEEKELCDAT